MSSLQERIEQDLVNAIKSGDAISRDTLRMLKAALKDKSIEKIGKLTDEEAITVLQKEAKNREEASREFRAGGRIDLTEKEEEEKKVIERYLPQPLPEEELTALVERAIEETRASSLSDLGRVMANIMPKIKARMEGGRVSEFVRRKLDEL